MIWLGLRCSLPLSKLVHNWSAGWSPIRQLFLFIIHWSFTHPNGSCDLFTVAMLHPMMHKLCRYNWATKNNIGWIYYVYSLAQNYFFAYCNDLQLLRNIFFNLNYLLVLLSWCSGSLIIHQLDLCADYSASGAITDHLPNHSILACLKWSQTIKFRHCK